MKSLFAALLLLTGSAMAAPLPVTSCAGLPAAPWPCQIDFAKFPAAPALPAQGPGKTYRAATAAQFNALSGTLQPGDQIILAAGRWQDAGLRFTGQGDPAHPIVIRAQTPGATILTGSSSLAIAGSNLVVSGLAFQDGNFTSAGFVALRLGMGMGRGCDYCILHHISIDNYNPAPGAAVRSFYLVLQGHDVTVMDSRFSGKHSAGAFLVADHPSNENLCAPGQPCLQRLLILRNSFTGLVAGANPDAEGDKYKIMQIGGDDGLLRSFSVIRGNIFRDNDGATALVDLKTSDIIVQDNKFLSNSGALDIREANRVLVDANLFDAGSRPGMGGVIVSSRDHWIVNNRFRGLSAPSDYYHWPVALTAGATEELGDKAQDYARAKNIVIAGNSFEKSASPPIALGIYPNAGLGRLLAPTNIVIINNTASGMTRGALKGLAAPGGPVGYIGDPRNFSGITLRGNSAN